MSDFVIARLEPTIRALREAATPQALKAVIDVAAAAEVYARRQRLGDEAIQYATCIRVDALSRLGVMLQAAPKNQGARGVGVSGVPPQNPTLTDLGIDKKTSAIAQQLADLDASTVESIKAGEVKMTAAIRSAREKKRADDLARPVATDLPLGVHHGDFRSLSESIADDSVDLVFTDPPYDAASAPLYEDAARIAARILKPGGSFIAYSGQTQLPIVLAGVAKHLRYWWTVAGVHEGGNQMLQKLGIRCGWKPLVWFVKGTRGDVQNVVLDVVRGDREKSAHAWQQAQSEAEYYVRELCTEAGVVVDFFLGGGTTAAACKALGRKFIGFEIDAAAIERAAGRLAA